MKKYKLPFAIPKGHYPILTQPYGDKAHVAWYKQNGVDIDEHNGADFVISGGRERTFGTRIVNPFPRADLSKTWFDHPMSTKGNGIEISFFDGERTIRMLAWHCSEIVPQGEYYEQDTIGYFGNSGLVMPAPTKHCPLCGTHIHLMTYVNGTLVDPLTVFNTHEWFTAEYPVYEWAVSVLPKMNGLLKKFIK